MIYLCMEIKDVIFHAHKLIEARQARNISKKEMAEMLGVSERAYVEYSRGGSSPLAMKALLNLLSKLDEEELVKIIQKWKENDRTENR